MFRESTNMFNGRLAILFCSFTAGSALAAEAIVLREAIILSDNLQIPKLIFESDCLGLINACTGKDSKREIQNLVEDIKALLSKSMEVKCLWTQRGNNLAAHEVASLKASDALPAQWQFHPPESLRSILVQDKMNACDQNR